MAPSSRRERLSSGLISRRGLLQAGGFGLLNLSMPGMVAARVDANLDRPVPASDKACIFLLLCGGPSHLDTWDLKPEAPAEIRGPYKPIATAVPGMQLCEMHERLSKLTKHFSLIRSMTHPGNISNHFDAMHNSLSGAPDAPADSPYLGAIMAKLRPSQRNVVSYAWLIKCVGDPVFCAPNIGTGGYLGAVHSPLFIGSAANHPAMANFKPPEMFGAVEVDRTLERKQLLENLDPTGGTPHGERSLKDWHDLRGQAFELATSSAGRDAFDLSREPANVRDRYGRHPLGQNLLLARRLVESGISFVTVNGWTGPAPGGSEGGSRPVSSSWDMHGGHMGMGNAFSNGSYGMGWCLPRLDEALSALFTDLAERGLLEKTLVVAVGEFGRSPKINTIGQPGRLHWPHCYSAIVGGAGIRGGMTYGASDKTGAYVKDHPVRPQDFAATIYKALDVPLDVRLGKDKVSKPITTGEPIHELFG